MHRQVTSDHFTVTDWVETFSAFHKPKEVNPTQNPAPRHEQATETVPPVRYQPYRSKASRENIEIKHFKHPQAGLPPNNKLREFVDQLYVSLLSSPPDRMGVEDASDKSRRRFSKSVSRSEVNNPVLTDSAPPPPPALVCNTLTGENGNQVTERICELSCSEVPAMPELERETNSLDCADPQLEKATQPGRLYSGTQISVLSSTEDVVAEWKWAVRSKFGRSEPPANTSLVPNESVQRVPANSASVYKTAPVPQPRRKWILLGVFLLIGVLVLTGGGWLFVWQDGHVSVAYKAVKATISTVFGSSAATAPAPTPMAQANVPKRPGRPRDDSKSSRHTQTSRNPALKSSTPPASQFKVPDTQNGRWSLPSTGIGIQFERRSSKWPTSGLTGSLPAQPALINEPLSIIGHVEQSFGERPAIQLMPEYPALALQHNVQGRVIVTATIGKDGTLRNIAVVGPPSPLNSTIMDAVRKWRYFPRYENGKPVESKTEMVFDFSITPQ